MCKKIKKNIHRHGNRIKQVRQDANKTQEELAEKMKTSKATISAYENDKIDIKSSTLIELSDNLGSTPDVLLGYRSPIDRDISKRRIVVLRGLTGEEAKRLVGMLLDSFEVFLDYKPGNNSDDSIENI